MGARDGRRTPDSVPSMTKRPSPGRRFRHGSGNAGQERGAVSDVRLPPRGHEQPQPHQTHLPPISLLTNPSLSAPLPPPPVLPPERTHIGLLPNLRLHVRNLDPRRIRNGRPLRTPPMLRQRLPLTCRRHPGGRLSGCRCRDSLPALPRGRRLRSDHVERLPGRRLDHPGPGAPVGTGQRRDGGNGGRSRHGRVVLDGHASGESGGGDGHQQGRGSRRTVHPRNSVGSGAGRNGGQAEVGPHG